MGLADVGYVDNEVVHPLPDWANFFVNLGHWLHETKVARIRRVIALALPSRAFAACFVATGIVLSNELNPREASEHFARLRSLPLGTSVTLLNKDRKLKGLFAGYRPQDGGNSEYVGIQVARDGGLTYWLPPKEAWRISVSMDSVSHLPRTQVGRKVNVQLAGDFLLHLVEDGQTRMDSANSRVDCLLVGQHEKLYREATEAQLGYIGHRRKLNRGTIQDIIRVRNFLGNNDIYRSRLIPPRKQINISHFSSEFPVVIYDGGIGYIEGQLLWKGADLVTILERSDPLFDTAIESINRRYIQDRLTDLTIDVEIPNGIELMSFTEASQ